MFRKKRNKENDQPGSFQTKRPIGIKFRKKIVFAIFAILLVSAVAIFANQKYSQYKAAKLKALTVKKEDPIPGWWYEQYFGANFCSQDNCKPDADPDKDGLTNTQEYFYHTDPTNAYTAKDKLNDGQLVAMGFDPSRTGHMTFDQAASDSNITGESLAFNDDVVKIVGEMSSLDNVPLPTISDNEITLSKDNNKDSILAYLKSSNDVMGKYFPSGTGQQLQDALTQGTTFDAEQIASAATAAANELRKITVPSDALTIQKDQLALLVLMPKVIIIPDDQAISDVNNTDADQWYDSVRGFAYLYQQIGIETTKLQNKYK